MADKRATAVIEFFHLALDESDVRKNLAAAAEATRRAGGQLFGRRPPVKAVRRAKAKRGLSQLWRAVKSLGRAGAAAREAELKRERSRRRRRLGLVALAGTATAVGVSGPARRKARQAFGGTDVATGVGVAERPRLAPRLTTGGLDGSPRAARPLTT